MYQTIMYTIPLWCKLEHIFVYSTMKRQTYIYMLFYQMENKYAYIYQIRLCANMYKCIYNSIMEQKYTQILNHYACTCIFSTESQKDILFSKEQTQNQKTQKVISTMTATTFWRFGKLNRYFSFSEQNDINIVLLASLLLMHHFHNSAN